MKTFHHVCSICGKIYGFTTQGIFHACVPCDSLILNDIVIDSSPSHGYCSEECSDMHVTQLLTAQAERSCRMRQSHISF